MTDTASQAQFTAKTLSEALPYIQRYAGQTIVVKYGGHAMVDPSLSAGFARDVVLLKALGIHPVVVHGGGPQIGNLLEKLGITSEFKGGLRVTDEATMEVVEMVLSGPINKSIVRAINQAGGKAVGLSGSDGNLIRAEKATKTSKDPDSHIEQVLDLGFVGEPSAVDTTVLLAMLRADANLIPVVAPVGVGADGARYNINADTAAGALAAALGASRLLLLTDVAGVLDKDKKLMREIPVADIPGLIADGTAAGGMIPKLETAAHSVNHGVGAAVILDGRAPHALLLELFTEHGAGTLVS
ncbi:MAG: acetylglutamate kinase [Alphaproteobacteria bacterium]|uniref:acetylglutamate kinase n=1 Tax=Hyphomonas sp. TaxID=87 RepID=UPI001DE68FCA|nr:acetylglutamate kinase [Alphaproteobacteria bacterium]MBU2085032.1 acetylglutamate kinase [Alphaproteobacteria bacterium]MBU2143890.1 acetylglutamate kinase [Alphaproteobacteria bacterium]MBU2198005.1 acetylglutamate kinase [Alphaproteobacteria bacterium]